MVTDRTTKQATAVVGADASRAQVETDLATLRQAAGNPGVDAAAVLEPLGLPDGPDDPAGIEALKSDLTGHADRRAQAIAHVTALAEDVVGHEQKLRAARQELSRREAARDGAADRLAVAQQEVEDSAAGHLAAWHDFACRAEALEPPGLVMPGPDEIGMADWAETLDGPHPAAQVLRAAHADSVRALADERAAAAGEIAEARAALAVLDEERLPLESGVAARPPVPYTRGAGTRDDLPGAALWQITDFAPGLTAPQRAGLEAAMEASGLLDAWLTADGRLLDPETHDVVASAGVPVPDSLAELIVPAVDRSDPRAGALSDALIGAVLGSVSAVERTGVPFATSGGRWGLGPLRGTWSKEHAEYLGHGAREEA